MVVSKDVQGRAGDVGHAGSADPPQYYIIGYERACTHPAAERTPAEIPVPTHSCGNTACRRAICCGDTLKEATHSLGIKVSTARTQLARLFAKDPNVPAVAAIALLVRAAHLGS
jgi:hypothetical protein